MQIERKTFAWTVLFSCCFSTTLAALVFTGGLHYSALRLLEERKTAAPRAVIGQMKAERPYRYPVYKVTKIVDGDTFDAMFHIWADLIRVQRVRVLGLDTPELRPRKGTDEEKEAEKLAAQAAMDFVAGILNQPDAALALVTDWKADSFGRVLAAVEYTDVSGEVRSLTAEVIAAGHGEP